MYSADVLSQLRSLNWLIQESRRLPSDSLEVTKIRTQIESIRQRLPTSILTYHDRLAARGQLSAAQVREGSCGACHLRLPRGLAGELTVPGRFAVCPNCGVFLWSAEAPAAEETPAPEKPAAKRSTRRKKVAEPAS